MSETVTQDATASAQPPASEASPGSEVSPATGGLPAIATWTAPAVPRNDLTPISARTGEPTRVWTIWVAAVAGFLATAVTGVATLVVYWNAAVVASLSFDEATEMWIYRYDGTKFAQASWLMGLVPTETASLGRVLLVVAVTVIAIVIGAACSITAYYAYDGRRWTRWASLIALVLSGAAVLLNQFGFFAIGFAVVMAIALWLPPSRRYFASWQAHRHHEQVFSPPVERVFYGPLPKYRTDDTWHS